MLRGTLYRLYYGGLVATALVLLLRGTPQIDAIAWPALCVWVAMMTITEIAPIRLPGGGVITVSSVLDYGAIIVFGPYVTAWMDIFSAITSRLLVRSQRPVHKSIFNISLYVVTAIVAGEAFKAAGGTVGRLDLPEHFPAVVAMGTAYFLLNTMGVSGIISLTRHEPFGRVWVTNFRWTVFHLLAFVPFGCIVAFLYLELGYLGVLLFMFPILLSRYSFKLYTDMRSDFLGFVETLTRVIEEVDPYTRHHSHRVSQYARQIAHELRIPAPQVETIATAALLHDIGKVSSQNADIIQSPKRLSAEQRARIVRHPLVGAEIVSRIRMLEDAAEYVRAHHERMDGRGYPFGLRGAEIPLGARILSVADSLDAMTSDRSYRPALFMDAAIVELRRAAGSQFDADVVAAVERLWSRRELTPLHASPAGPEAEAPPLERVVASSRAG